MITYAEWGTLWKQYTPEKIPTSQASGKLERVKAHLWFLLRGSHNPNELVDSLADFYEWVDFERSSNKSRILVEFPSPYTSSLILDPRHPIDNKDGRSQVWEIVLMEHRTPWQADEIYWIKWRELALLNYSIMLGKSEWLTSMLTSPSWGTTEGDMEWFMKVLQKAGKIQGWSVQTLDTVEPKSTLWKYRLTGKYIITL